MTLIALSMSAFSTSVLRSEGRTSRPLILTEMSIIHPTRLACDGDAADGPASSLRRSPLSAPSYARLGAPPINGQRDFVSLLRGRLRGGRVYSTKRGRGP